MRAALRAALGLGVLAVVVAACSAEPAATTTDPPEVAETRTPPTHGSVQGLTMFRGNPSRSFYGTGPMPQAPEILWRYPDSAMCGRSDVAGEERIWCGTGWTGQPVVWERPDGVTEVIFGAFDKRVHFLDAATGEPTRPPFEVGDIVKGSVTLDPDGYPLLYVGSRVDRFMVVALDREEPKEVWSLPSSYVEGRWDDDWDSSAVIVDGYLLEGGENSWWFAVELNRSYDVAGLVRIDPQVVAAIPAWNDETLAAVGNQQSIESSTAIYGDTAFFANSAGRVVGVDISDLASGTDVVLDFWTGDDVDATIVIDDAGMLYVAAQVDLQTPRAAELGQLMKLDPTRPINPIVWSREIPTERGSEGGAWATPALHAGLLYLPTNAGELLAINTTNGAIVWSDDVGSHAWSSPVVVDETLMVAVNCETTPALRAYDVTDPRSPRWIWELEVSSGCIESTPAVWNGTIFVGSRDGFFYAIADR